MTRVAGTGPVWQAVSASPGGRTSPTRALGGALTLLKEGRPEVLLGIASGNDDDPDAARRVIGDTIAHTLLEDGSATYAFDWSGPPPLVDGAGERLGPWTKAYEALEGDETAVAALDAWLDRYGIADSGMLVCRTRYLDRLAASWALYTFRDTGPIYVKRFLGYRPTDLIADARARHVPWHAIASSNGRVSRTMVVTERDGATWKLKWGCGMR